ncbi:hypothetical protein THAOC_20401 [Thalassiosira oceanica]|uniref:Fibronectin type-III domain-containing protein n=1 Tax=Thalassiosira oceanica TaxID=159749 RepID=K0S3F8_THAOC|nr:hypothetical protein THAOC_20401 [Thalassiosira oceanica]|eukprot:EJK59389.1 hypothetical protein THAOC_20401 [Thalassiosira oceanica]
MVQPMRKLRLNELEMLESVGKTETLECWQSQGVCYSIVIKSGRVDTLDTVNIVPESDWRGTGAVLVAESGRAQEPMSFKLINLDKHETYRVRVSAMNQKGYSVPSDELELTPESTRPGKPRLLSSPCASSELDSDINFMVREAYQRDDGGVASKEGLDKRNNQPSNASRPADAQASL